jgi:dihydropyrimidine dehydrogenase (NAD+) subunit PreA
MLAINNVELISDRPIEVNLREIAEVKRAWPDRAVIVSAMVESKREAWHELVKQIVDTGADGIELNYGCPHGMSERGMGAAIGQVPEFCQQISSWVMEVATIPVIQKLTPNVTNIVMPARAGVAAGVNALSLINTINSIVGVDLETLELTPSIGGKGGHGGYAGPAIKPIALNMLAQLGNDEVVSRSSIPISGMGGISTWQDAAQFLLLGASSLQVCTAAMHYGYRIVEDLCDGLSNWMDEKGFSAVAELVGKSLHRVAEFKDFDLSFKTVARIDAAKCIKCNLCYIACNDTAHQCIDLKNTQGETVEPNAWDVRSNGKDEAIASRPQPEVREQDCVGCRLCYNVCPVDDCIRMVELPGERPPVTWGELSSEHSEVTEEWEAMKAYRAQMGIDIH